MRASDPILVVGAGFVGACIAHQLARAGAPVTVVACGAPAATARSFAWIGASPGGFWPGGAEDLRPSILADHRRLAAEVPGTATRWTGSVSWPPPPGSTVDARALEPRLRRPQPAAHERGDGGLDPLTAVPALLRGIPVVRSRPANASTVVFAAGVATAELAGVDLPVTASPAFGMRVAGPPGLVRHIVATPDFEVREVRAGRYLFTGPHADAARLLDAFRATFHVDGRLRILAQGLGQRPMPADGPIIGEIRPGRHVAVMHSGICLAPTVARLLADEILTGRRAAQLERCRPRP